MKSISATDARRQLFDLIEQAGKPGSFISITHRDLPDVVLMSSEEFEGWIETMEVMSDPKLMKDIRAGLKEKETVTLDTLEKKYDV
ncbi:hypothetical protein A3D11_03940 [Candidatus Peribacteria bacterium RIFCSPHIGHO2_02_FULL_49_16]|nr:MAG: hypothetical protein A2880_03175 [Candidatus Peribacteria bacterium RIFCSPHIGHO2_01_FULL_49_38]OGJ59153.1 MAG: hypothetical protein A3D11_03940 [Candidatus Peribacteria bacterium RIFCSPHIGHO2_02_FULL_49_16]